MQESVGLVISRGNNETGATAICFRMIGELPAISSEIGRQLNLASQERCMGGIILDLHEATAMGGLLMGRFSSLTRTLRVDRIKLVIVANDKVEAEFRASHLHGQFHFVATMEEAMNVLGIAE